MTSQSISQQHRQQEADPVIDSSELRGVLGCFTTGVVVVTSLRDDGTPVGLTVNSFSSVSLAPPLVLWSIGLGAPSLSTFRSCEYFAVNILKAEQHDLCSQFARPSADKFAGVEWDRGIGGAPILRQAAAHINCRTWARYPGGDHEIHVGRVLAAHKSEEPPLVFHKGEFWQLMPMRR